MQSDIQKNIEEIKEDIKKFSPYPEQVKLVAVTKYVDSDTVREVLAAGHNILGENRVQILKSKKDELKEFDNIEWHLIGQLQKNKIKYIIDYISLIHSVDSVELAEELSKRAEKAGRVVDILLELNISGEESKSGYTIDELIKNIEVLKTFKNINIKGLMTMAPFTDNEIEVRDVFRKLRELKESLNSSFFNNTLTELSMGMTNDYKIALEEGSTIIRIGTKIFK